MSEASGENFLNTNYKRSKNVIRPFLLTQIITYYILWKISSELAQNFEGEADPQYSENPVFQKICLENQIKTKTPITEDWKPKWKSKFCLQFLCFFLDWFLALKWVLKVENYYFFHKTCKIKAKISRNATFFHWKSDFFKILPSIFPIFTKN